MTTSRYDWLVSRRTKLRAKIDAIDDADGVPTNYSVDGQSVSKADAVKQLEERLNEIETEIALLSGGGEYLSEGFSA